MASFFGTRSELEIPEKAPKDRGLQITDVNRLTSEYGGNVGDWSKMTSNSTYKAPDGQQINIHWYQNKELGLNVEFKSIANEWSKKAGATLLDAGATLLGGVAIAAEVLDPATYLTSGSKSPEGSIPGPWWCFGCYQAPQSSQTIGPQSSGAAGGGFLLYPNKANTNMMQSVYAK